MTYTYNNLKIALYSIASKYPSIEQSSIGESVMGRSIYCMRLGRGERKIICVGAHHALEWLTSVMLVCFADSYANAYTTSTPLYGHDIAKLFEQCSICIIPMLNPDGVELVAGGMPKNHPKYIDIVNMCGNLDFASVWQANINGVDLNHNYNALWAEGTLCTDAVLSSAPTRFAGMFPESEPESRALADFTRKIAPDMVIAYHSQGREIFYDFNGKMPGETENVAEQMAKLSGYTLSKPEGFASFGGYKDWFIDAFDRPGFTVEIGKGKNPIGLEQLADVLDENSPLILGAADM